MPIIDLLLIQYSQIDLDTYCCTLQLQNGSQDAAGGGDLFPEGPDCNLELHLDEGEDLRPQTPTQASPVIARVVGREGLGVCPQAFLA